MTQALAKGARRARQIARRLIRNPVLIALLAGVAVSVTGPPLPRIMQSPVDLMANASAALSFFSISAVMILVLP